MRNRITNAPAKLIPQISAAIPGVTTYGAALGMSAGLETTLATKKGELVGLDADYEQTKTDLRNSTRAKNLAMKNGSNHLRTVRELMRPILTPTYSQAWDAIGFTGSLAVPTKADAMLLALTKLGSYLTANPALGTAEPNLVAAKTNALATALSSAIAALNTDKADRQRLYEDRAGAAEELRFLLREVLSVLHLKLTPLDARWVEFGFNKPGAQPVPDVPAGLTAVQVGPNALLVKWPDVSRAQYYRLWKRVIGVDPELVSVGTTVELDFLLEQVPANSLVEVALSAGNDGGESATSSVLPVQTA